jgi:RNA polymerase sigma-70 factor (ECF subfamily)
MSGAKWDMNALVSEHSEMVLNLAYRITGNRQDAEDVVQETFLKVFQGIEQFRGECAISTWIYRIAMNTCLKTKRKLDATYLESLDERIEAFREDIPAEVQEWFDEPDKAVYLQALLTEVNEGCLHFMTFRLTDEQRIPYIMYAVLRFTYREIADVLEVSEAVVKSRLHRAHASLEKYFRSRCQWLDPAHPSCTCRSRVGFALAYDPELLGRVRLKARATPADAPLIEFFHRQAKEISEIYHQLPQLSYKMEGLERYLGELSKKTATKP